MQVGILLDFAKQGEFPYKLETYLFSFVCTRLQIKWLQHVEHILQMVACLVSGSRTHQQSLEKLRFVFWYFIIYLSNWLITY